MIDQELALLALRERVRAAEAAGVEVGDDTVVEENDETNFNATSQLESTSFHAFAQSFQVASRVRVRGLRFYSVAKVGSPTGSVFAKLYAASGTHGTNAVPTGSALATSAAVDVATLVDAGTWVEFDFVATVDIEADTTYCAVLEFAGGGAGNYLTAGVDFSSPSHDGNHSAYNGSTWSILNTDLVFGVNGRVIPDLSATASGYARSSGSFVTDGFRVGMEILAAGFSKSANNGYALVTSVSALALGIKGGRTAEAAGAGKSLVAGLPEHCAWENVGSADASGNVQPDFKPAAGRPYIEEELVPATSSQPFSPADGSLMEETGLYVIRWYGLTGFGSAAIRRPVDALKARLSPGTALTLSDGSTLRVRRDTGPYVGEIRRVPGGWSVLTLRVPWYARSQNTVLA